MVKNLFDETVDQDFHQWSMATIEAVYDQVFTKLSVAYDEAVSFSLYRHHAFKDTMLQEIMSDAVGVCRYRDYSQSGRRF